MAAWISVTGQMGLSYPGSVDTVKRTAVGTIARFRNETLGEGEFIYLSGAANVDPGDVCSYEIAYNASVATSVVVPWAGTANMPVSLCVATAATVASTWGWYQISGSAIVNSNGTVADGDDLFWQAAGVVSATLVAGKQIMNAIAASANGVPATNQIIVTMDRPLAQGVNNPAVASSLVVGTTTISGGATGNVLYDNAGVVGERAGTIILGSSGTASSVSSGTAETQLAAITVPAGAMGTNGSLRITMLWSYTNSANNKTMRLRFSGASGTAILSTVATTTAGAYTQTWLRNNGTATAQKYANTSTGAFLVGGSAPLTSAIDTSAATIVYLSGQTANSGETITLEGYTVELIPGV